MRQALVSGLVGFCFCAQRARLSIQGYEETSYSPCFQGLGGIKFFVISTWLFLAKRSGHRGIHSNVKRTPIGNVIAFQRSIWSVGWRYISDSRREKAQPRACSSCS